MPHKNRTAALTFVACLAIGCIVGYLQSPLTVRGYQAKAFVVHRTEKSFKEGSNRAFVSEQTFARRADGSWSLSRTGRAADGGSTHGLEYFDSVRMIYVHTEPVTRSVMTRAIPAADAQRQLEAGFKPCGGLNAGYESGPHSTMLGYDVIEVSESKKAGTEIDWVAPALDSFALRSVFRTPDGGRDDFDVSEVQEVNPPANLFEVPPGYVERSPKEIQALYAEQIPGAEVFRRMSCQWSRSDTRPPVRPVRDK